MFVNQLVDELKDAAAFTLGCKETESAVTLRKDETEVTFQYLLDILRFTPHAEVRFLNVYRSHSLLALGTDEVSRLTHFSVFARIRETDAILPSLQMFEDAHCLLYLCAEIVLVVTVANKCVGHHLKELIDGEPLTLGNAVELLG